EAATWKPIREVSARTSNPSDGNGIYAAPGSSSFCGHGLAALGDGTLVTGLWGVGKESGFVQRSTDEGLSWSQPIYLADPAKFKVYPSQIHQLRDGRLILMAGMYG